MAGQQARHLGFLQIDAEQIEIGGSTQLRQIVATRHQQLGLVQGMAAAVQGARVTHGQAEGQGVPLGLAALEHGLVGAIPQQAEVVQPEVAELALKTTRRQLIVLHVPALDAERMLVDVTGIPMPDARR